MKRATPVAIALGVVVAVAVAVWRAIATRRARDRDTAAGAVQWTCACGQRFRVSGAGRHRVLWLQDAAPGDPVLGDRCPTCDRVFPDDLSTV